jgi:hypothetical protein
MDNMGTNLFVTKSTGEKSRFSAAKLERSLQRAGANKEQIDLILNEINFKLYEGISTKQIYKLAFALLKSNSRHTAARYNLKQAIMELGPSGYPFEKYIAEILNAQGYKTKVGQIIQGKCVTHEIDVIAEKQDHMYMVECKYHNLRGVFCDVKVPMYIQSRFKDVESQLVQINSHSNKFYQGWVVTNTRFSTDALQYGTCAGLNLLSWDYPANKGLREQIDLLGLYPITCLTSLTKAEKQRLLERKIVLCKEIYHNEKLLVSAGVKEARLYTVRKEAQQLCTKLITKKKETIS